MKIGRVLSFWNKNSAQYIHSCKCARTYLHLIAALFFELDKNIICSSGIQHILKEYLSLVFRLAMLLPPYLIFADLLDASPDLQSIRRAVHFINSYLVSKRKF